MVNFKAAGLGVVITFVVTLLEVIFLPLIQTNLNSLKDTAPDAGTNSTIDSMVKILYLAPLGTIIGGFIGSFAAGMLAK